MGYILNMTEDKRLILSRNTTTYVGENNADSIKIFLPTAFRGYDLKNECKVLLCVVIPNPDGSSDISGNTVELDLTYSDQHNRYISYFPIKNIYTQKEQIVILKIEILNDSGMIAYSSEVSFKVHKHNNPYAAPVVSASVVSPSNGGVVEAGTTQSVTKIRVAVTKKSSAITSVEIFDGSTSLGVKTEGVSAGGTFDFPVAVNVSSNKSFTAKVTDTTGKVVSANTEIVSFVYPFYTGVCAEETAIDEALISSLIKKVETKGTKTVDYTCNNECMVFMYPANYGKLSKIIDPNNFDVTNTFTANTVSVTTLDGKSTSYYAYVNGASTVSSFSMNFQF